jgi:chromate reductase
VSTELPGVPANTADPRAFIGFRRGGQHRRARMVDPHGRPPSKAEGRRAGAGGIQRTGASAMRTIAVIVGSIRENSINRELARALERLAEGKLIFKMIRIDDLPMFRNDDAMPGEVVRFKKEVEACDGVLFVTPEHNHAVPAALKNAFDWGSRPYGHNSWNDKPAAIIGTSAGRLSTSLAQQNLRTMASVHVAALLGYPQAMIQHQIGLFAEDGTVTDELTLFTLNTFIDRFSKLVDAWAIINALTVKEPLFHYKDSPL